MNWHIEEAKNEQKTVKLNDIYLYSKYNPQRDVEKFMTTEVDTTNKKFILVGLGLGYHLDYLVEHLENIEVQYILLSYKRWFDQAFSKTSMKIFNTSEKGAKLKNTTFFNTTLKS